MSYIFLDSFQQNLTNLLFIQATSHHLTNVLVYVDDILVIRSDHLVLDLLITNLNYEFSLNDLGPINYFLGIQVKETSEGSPLSQTKYIMLG